MNIPEFYRQAHLLRDYTTEILPPGEDTAITSVVIVYSKFLVLGRLVVAMVSGTFTIEDDPPTNILVKMPTLIKLTAASKNIGIFSGEVDDFVSGKQLSSTSGFTQHIRVGRYDKAGMTAGTGKMINGIFFYENGEVNV